MNHQKALCDIAMDEMKNEMFEDIFESRDYLIEQTYTLSNDEKKHPIK